MVATYPSAGRTPHVVNLVLLVVSCNVVHAYDGNKSAITCQAGTFSTGDTANITCYFKRNISADGVHIFVGWRPLNAAGGSKERRALACFKTSSNGMKCNEEPGVYFNNEISDRLTLVIPKVSLRYAGDYTCRKIPKHNEKTIPCGLRVKDADSSGHRFVLHQPVIISLAVVASAATIVLILAGTRYCVKKRQKDKKSDSHKLKDRPDEQLLSNGAGKTPQTSEQDAQKQDTEETDLCLQVPDPEN